VHSCSQSIGTGISFELLSSTELILLFVLWCALSESLSVKCAGAPHILQSDNGRDFAASIITELKELWLELIIVHGKPKLVYQQLLFRMKYFKLEMIQIYFFTIRYMLENLKRSQK
jgi:hypothetical protein